MMGGEKLRLLLLVLCWQGREGMVLVLRLMRVLLDGGHVAGRERLRVHEMLLVRQRLSHCRVVVVVRLLVLLHHHVSARCARARQAERAKAGEAGAARVAEG